MKRDAASQKKKKTNTLDKQTQESTGESTRLARETTTPTTLSRRERSKIVQRCLGRNPPTYQTRSNLKKQIDTIDRGYAKLMNAAKDARRAKEDVDDPVEQRALEEDAQAYEELAYRHAQGAKGLRGT